MFSEFLASRPLSGLLRADRLRLFPGADDRAAWEGIAPEYRREIAEYAGKYAGVPYPARPASAFLAFVREGNRT